LNKILPSNGLGPGPDEVVQNSLKLMTSLTKNLKPKIKNFFSLHTRRPTESFKGLNSFLTRSADELSCR